MKYKSIIIISICLFCFACKHKNKVNKVPSIAESRDSAATRRVAPRKIYTFGEVVDSYNGVNVYYNGSVSTITERNLAPDGYNLGLKYQCVEFVKRYYYEYFHHAMPDTYGDAKDFFDKSLADGALNPKRDLLQFKNPSKFRPQPNDIIVWKGNKGNPFGHIAIISDTNCCVIEIVQQNPGPTAPSRDEFATVLYKGKWKVCALDIVGWLRRREDGR